MDNLKKRRGFACKLTKLLNDNFSEEAISFYTDAAGFQHKYNPQNEVRSIRTMAWRLKNEGLYPHCTAKRSHLGLGGRVAHFILEIAHQRGVGLCEQDEGKINGDMLSDFIKTHFQETFSWHRIPKGKRFFQDGCPVQSIQKAREALDTIGAIKFSTPPRSSDFNPMEKYFSLFQKWTTYSCFWKNNKNYETFKQFYIRVKNTLENTPTKYIPRRMLMLIKWKGQIIKY